jgi:Ca2+:H+ antiporter
MPTISPGPLTSITWPQRIMLGAAVALTLLAEVVEEISGAQLLRFLVAGLALAALAGVVGEAVDALGRRLGPSVTGLVQATLGNLPELFVGIFALRQGLDDVVRSALIGSVLGTALLVLGCAFIAGGLRHGTQRFAPEEPRLNATLLLLAVAALLVPTLASRLNTPAAAHPEVLSYLCAGVLLVVYGSSVSWSLGRTRGSRPDPGEGTWPLGLAVGVLVVASAGSALSSDWFVGALQPATRSLGLSQTFTGLVVVAIASNAVEQVVGIRFALQGKPDLTISTTLSSPLQVALFLIPVLVLLSSAIGPSTLTLVFPPLLVAALGVSAVVVLAIVFDGEYTWVEGVALVGLYGIIAGSLWWG